MASERACQKERVPGGEFVQLSVSVTGVQTFGQLDACVPDGEFSDTVEVAAGRGKAVESSPDRQRADSINKKRTKSGIQSTDRQRRDSDKKNFRRLVRQKRTNLRVIGLSLNRSQKWTALLSTTPRL